MKRYAVNLKLPFVSELQHLVQGLDVHPKLGHFALDADRLPADLRAWLAGLGIQISHCEIFYTPPYARLPIHVDGPVISNAAKLNWCYGADGSVMNWFRLKNPTIEPPMKITVIGTRYVQPTADQCIMVHSAKIKQPTLVNVGQPHSVINSTAEGRWVVSVVLSMNGVSLEWDDAVTIFQKANVL